MKFQRKFLKYYALLFIILSTCCSERVTFYIADCFVGAIQHENNDEASEYNILKQSDSESQKTENNDSSVENSYAICELLSDDVRTIFNSVDPKMLEELSEKLNSIYEHMQQNYNGSLATEISGMAVAALLINNGFVKNNIQDMVKSKINYYRSEMKNRYAPERYYAMDSDSKEFSGKFNQSAYCSPETIIFINSDKKLSETPIKYNQKIFLSLKDFLNVSSIQEEPDYMKNNSDAIVIKSKENKTLEIEPGSNKIQVDDHQYTMYGEVFKPIKMLDYVPVDMLEFAGSKIIEFDNSVLVY